jgi:hypothetical protein
MTKHASGLRRCWRRAGIVLMPRELEQLEVTDVGLGRLEEIGLQLVVYENNNRYCAKELVLFPHQLFPEHRHPPVGDDDEYDIFTDPKIVRQRRARAARRPRRAVR